MGTHIFSTDVTVYETFEEFVEAMKAFWTQGDIDPRPTKWLNPPDEEFHLKKFGIRAIRWEYSADPFIFRYVSFM